jgi:drug/metabolite transporter (DMT)-like permease
MKALHGIGLPVAFVLVWSSAYVAGSMATALIAPLTVTLWRFAVASGVLGLIAWLRHERWPRGLREFGGAALTGVVMFALQFASLYMALADHMPAGTTALIACSAPLIVAAASAGLGWERLSPRQWFGVALGVLGVVITLADRLGRPPSVVALGWTLLGLTGLVAGTMLQGRLRMPAGPAALASVELAAAAVVLAVSAPFVGSLRIPLTLPALLTFGYVAVIAGVGAPLLFFALIKQRGATRASSLLFVVPSVTALCAWGVLGTPVGLTALAGFAVAGTGVWLARAGASIAGRPRDSHLDGRDEVAAKLSAARSSSKLAHSGRHAPSSARRLQLPEGL